MNIIRAIAPSLFWIISFAFHAQSQQTVELNKGWKCSAADSIAASGEALSTRSYSLQNWMAATVPGTVLTSMLNNKQIPDPFYGMNNQLIPDIFNTGNRYYTYWFVNDFTIKEAAANEQVWLNFRGVNYSCNVFLNGKKLNDSLHEGMFLRQLYNITNLLDRKGRNRLAVIVYPPDPPGNPNGGQGGDGTIAKNVTHQYVAGWDWIQPVRDRNTGIWDKVTIERTGSVKINNPHIVTKVPGKRMPSGHQEPALIEVSAELHNTSSATVTGVLSYLISGNRVTKDVSLQAGETSKIDMPVLTLKEPRLWWPNGYGEQSLENIDIQFIDNRKKISDRHIIKAGIREIQTEWNAVTQSRQISVNGQKIFIKGGNWIISDMMLRLSKERYDAEIRYHRDMNLNLVRVWGGALIERPEFYEACDRYGLLVFQDFWMTGDCNGRWNDKMKLDDRAARRDYPDDHKLFIRSAADQVKLIRNHPSLAIWCGGNEITPPEDILTALRDSLLPALDGTRWFVDASTSDSMSLNTIGGGGDGPYNIQPTDTFWKHRTYPFNSEVGSVGTGDYESLKRFIPASNMNFPVYTYQESVDSVWRYHKYIGYSKYLRPYGDPKDIRDFARKAQLVNYHQYRSLIEGFSSQMWNWYTGVIIWKTQNPWTALRGQMYDYYLDPNAALFGLRSGGRLLNIIYNPVTGDVLSVNNSFETLNNYSVGIQIIDINGNGYTRDNQIIRLQNGAVQKIANIRDSINSISNKLGSFLQLTLTNEKGRSIAENFYWLPDAQGTYSGLNQMRPTMPVVKARRLKAGVIEVTIKNPDHTSVSFFNRISLISQQNRERILPVFYDDNYISLLPGASKTIVVEYPGKVALPMIEIEGWNTKKQLVQVKKR